MKFIIVALPFAIGSLAVAESNAPAALVSSRAPFSVQGVNVPVIGGTAWPVAAGDTIETKSAPAEIRLKNGTRIFVPAASRYVVPSPQVGSASIRANLSGNASSHGNSDSTSTASSKGVLTLFDGGAMAVMSREGTGSRAVGNVPVALSLTALLQTYGVNSPIVGTIDQAISSKGAVIQFDAATNTYYVTGVQAVIGSGAPQYITLVISPSHILVTPGTVNPGSPLPPALLTITPGVSSPCKGGSLKPADVSNSVVGLPVGGSC